MAFILCSAYLYVLSIFRNVLNEKLKQLKNEIIGENLFRMRKKQINEEYM